MDRLYTPAILDIEASGFGKGSYPIEIGVAAETGEVHSWLVLPQPDWTHWREEAASLHLISREELLSDGVAPTTIANELNALFEGQTLYSDGWGFDSVEPIVLGFRRTKRPKRRVHWVLTASDVISQSKNFL